MGGGQSTSATERGGFLLFLGLVSLALLAVVLPFLTPMLWAALAAIMFQPLYRWFLVRRPKKETQAALASLRDVPGGGAVLPAEPLPLGGAPLTHR